MELLSRSKSNRNLLSRESGCLPLVKSHRKLWQDLPGKRACRICVEYRDYGMRNEEHCNEVIDWLANNMAALINVFKPILDNIMKTIH